MTVSNDMSTLKSLPNAIAAKVDALFQEAVDEFKTSGIAYGLVNTRTGELIHAGGVGSSHLENGSEVADAFTPAADSISRIASMSKSFTAASILKLRDEGKLKLDDPVAKYLPYFANLALPSEDSPEITLRMLLTMSAGLVTDNPWGDRQEAMTQQGLKEMVEGGLSFMAIPGTQFQYSNASYVLLGEIIFAVTGQSYADYVRENFLRPLGMNDTDYVQDGLDKSRVLTGHRLNEREDKQRFEAVPFDTHGVYGAMAGIYSTVEDIAKWVTFLSSALPAIPEAGPAKPVSAAEADRLLARASRREMQQGYRMIPAQLNKKGAFSVSAAYGMGLFVENWAETGLVIGHSGGYPGFGSFMGWHADSGVGVIALANSKYAPATLLSYQVLELLKKEGVLTGSIALPLADATKDAIKAAKEFFLTGSDQVADQWFSDNMDLDIPRAERLRRKELACARAEVDLAKEWPEPTVLSPYEVRFDWPASEDGKFMRIYLLMDPRTTPRLQGLDIGVIVPPKLKA